MWYYLEEKTLGFFSCQAKNEENNFFKNPFSNIYTIQH